MSARQSISCACPVSAAAHPRAFTLLEVLVAAILLAILLLAVMAFLSGVQHNRAALVDNARRARQVTVTIDRLEADLFAVVAGDPVVGAGVRGTGESLAVLCRTIPAADGQASAARSGLALHTYTFDAPSGVLSITPSDGLLGSGGPAHESATGLARVRLRYYASGPSGIFRWVDSFDSLAQGGLPRAVEVAVWYAGAARPAPDPASSNDSATPDESTLTDKDVPAAPPDRVRVISIAGVAL